MDSVSEAGRGVPEENCPLSLWVPPSPEERVSGLHTPLPIICSLTKIFFQRAYALC